MALNVAVLCILNCITLEKVYFIKNLSAFLFRIEQKSC